MSGHGHIEDGAVLSQHVREEIEHWLAKFPQDRRRSAVIAALHAVQHERGHLDTASMDAVAAYLGLPPIQVYEVASFYSMFERLPAAGTTSRCARTSRACCAAARRSSSTSKSASA